MRKTKIIRFKDIKGYVERNVDQLGNEAKHILNHINKKNKQKEKQNEYTK